MPAIAAERRKCPKQFQDRLTRKFGKNQFGDPNFKIVWGQSEFIRMGNVWRDKHGNEQRGYLLRYQVAGGQPCWTIMRWHAPFEYGSPAAYYANTYDTLSKLHIVGEYPWRGRYEVVQPLISKEFKDGKLIVTHFPLCNYLIDTVIPMIEQFRRLSVEQKAAARAAVKAAEEKEQTEFIADILEDTAPTWWGPVSYTRQGIKTSVLQRKMEQIQKVWDRWSTGGKSPVFGRGIQQGKTPQRLN